MGAFYYFHDVFIILIEKLRVSVPHAIKEAYMTLSCRTVRDVAASFPL
jgi:hypothetical protein